MFKHSISHLKCDLKYHFTRDCMRARASVSEGGIGGSAAFTVAVGMALALAAAGTGAARLASASTKPVKPYLLTVTLAALQKSKVSE